MEKNKNKELTPAEKKQFIEMYEQQQQDKRLLSKLRDNFRLANTEYSKIHRRMQLSYIINIIVDTLDLKEDVCKLKTKGDWFYVIDG